MSDAKQKPSMPRAGGTPKKTVNPMAAWEERTTLVKREVEAERIATDAKTARLRALRLAREAEIADEEMASGEKPKPSPAARKRKPRII